MAAAVGRDTLPEHWSYGVCRDGRVFFIDDLTRATTWLHPRTGEPVNSGHMIRSDLPRGWEEGFSEEGASYFIETGYQLQRAEEVLCSSVSRKREKGMLFTMPELRSALWKSKLGTVREENATCGLVQQGIP
ncbi:hypothetical protein DUI87_09771 [Hirundo rustica rustica]|uniref:WW domain-containing protein n=1 Tax=Hirundo rustica rustica TaxID=333673 RepID=A0A3M0KG94_HIRRU|nr:hypothetical protein DUI87_09771 [Hirundo rustica rustica]